MAVLTREAILKAADLPRETVEVPEWGGSVVVSTMSGADRDAFEASIVTSNGKADMRNMRAKFAAACVVNAKGERLFSPGDVEALGAKNAAALDRVVRVAQRLNRIGDSHLEELKGN